MSFINFFSQAFKNFCADIIYIGILLSVYSYSYYYTSFLSRTTINILIYFALGFVVLSFINHYIIEKKKIGKTYILFTVFKKNLKCFTNLGFKFDWTKAEKKIVFSYIVKAFYIPLMMNFSVGNYYKLKNLFLSSNFEILNLINFFNDHFYFIALAIIFLLDTLIFTFGYLFESRLLNNQIKSVDTSFLGWAFTLLCYPPFNSIVDEFATWTAMESAYFFNDFSTFLIRFLIVLLLIIYVSASFSLGTKASNLTNRGIVSSGAYSIVRHPAYITKNMAWWLMSIPIIIQTPIFIFGTLAWSFIYFMRAVTEENHLMQDPDYIEYSHKVKYRFIPGVY